MTNLSEQREEKEEAETVFFCRGAIKCLRSDSVGRYMALASSSFVVRNEHHDTVDGIRRRKENSLAGLIYLSTRFCHFLLLHVPSTPPRREKVNASCNNGHGRGATTLKPFSHCKSFHNLRGISFALEIICIHLWAATQCNDGEMSLQRSWSEITVVFHQTFRCCCCWSIQWTFPSSTGLSLSTLSQCHRTRKTGSKAVLG